MLAMCVLTRGDVLRSFPRTQRYGFLIVTFRKRGARQRWRTIVWRLWRRERGQVSRITCWIVFLTNVMTNCNPTDTTAQVNVCSRKTSKACNIETSNLPSSILSQVCFGGQLLRSKQSTSEWDKMKNGWNKWKNKKTSINKSNIWN